VPLALLVTAPDHDLSPKPVAAKQVRQLTQVKRVVRVERRTVTVPRAAVAAPVRAPQPAGATAGLGVDTRRGSSRAVAPVAAPRCSAGSTSRRGAGRRSGSPSSSSGTPSAPTTGTPTSATAGGSGERSANTTAMQPKQARPPAL
jgi:hypothetical protein